MSYGRANVSSELRKKLQFAGFTNAETLVFQSDNPVTFPIGGIAVTGCHFVDVCGYLKGGLERKGGV